MEQAPIQKKKDNTGAIATGLVGLVGGAALADYFEMDLFDNKKEVEKTVDPPVTPATEAPVATVTTPAIKEQTDELETYTSTIYDNGTSITDTVVIYDSRDDLARDGDNNGIDNVTHKAIILDPTKEWEDEDWSHSLLQDGNGYFINLDESLGDTLDDFGRTTPSIIDGPTNDWENRLGYNYINLDMLHKAATDVDEYIVNTPTE